MIANALYGYANGSSCVGCCAITTAAAVHFSGRTLSKTHATKDGQHLSELKADSLRKFIDKAIVSFCNRCWLCVAATRWHWHCEDSV